MPKITKRTLRRDAKRREQGNALPFPMNLIAAEPVDPDKFCAAAAAWSEAAESVPAEAGSVPIAHLELDGQPYSIMDVPFNLVMSAAKEKLRMLGVDDCSAYLWRISTLQVMLEESPHRFGDLIVEEASGRYRIADGVIYAAALAKLTNDDPERPGAFDMDDLVSQARRYEQAHPAA